MKHIVVGAGSIGKRHILNLCELGEEVSFVEPDSARRGDVERDTGARGVSSLAEAGDFESLIVATPASSHISLARTGLTAGANVFIEKPLAVSLLDIDALEKEAAESKKTVMVACNFRFHPFFSRAAKFIKDTLLGKISSIKVTYRYELARARPHASLSNVYATKASEGGGVIFDSGTHVVDYLSALFGDCIPLSARTVRDEALHIDTESDASLSATFGRVPASIELSYKAEEPEHRFALICENGTAEWDLVSGREIIGEMVIDLAHDSALPDFINEMYLEQFRAYLRACRGEEATINPVHKAAQTLKSILDFRHMALID